MWKVYNKKKWIGIIETNYAYAYKYWTLARGYKLVPYDPVQEAFPIAS